MTDPPVADLAAMPEPLLLQLGVPAGLVAALPVVVGHPAEQPPVTRRNPPRLLDRR